MHDADKKILSNLEWMIANSKHPCYIRHYIVNVDIYVEKLVPGYNSIGKSDLVRKLCVSLHGGAPNLLLGFLVLHPHLEPGPIDGDAVHLRLFNQPQRGQPASCNILFLIQESKLLMHMVFFLTSNSRNLYC